MQWTNKQLLRFHLIHKHSQFSILIRFVCMRFFFPFLCHAIQFNSFNNTFILICNKYLFSLFVCGEFVFFSFIFIFIQFCLYISYILCMQMHLMVRVNWMKIFNCSFFFFIGESRSIRWAFSSMPRISMQIQIKRLSFVHVVDSASTNWNELSSWKS